ncbi:MAG: M48 family metalloprotease [Minwuia sp.]|nr:M48 family metalloprotease [Minwuia sp.]
MDLTRRHLLCGCAATALTGCVSQGGGSRIQAGHAPTLDSVEGGLWDIFNRAEADLKFSPLRMTDEELNRYVSDIACRLAGRHCADMRVYLVRTPFFNANMAPNGMMQVWSGLMLRCQNEAQLAAVIGHEIGHYLKRHSLQRFEQIRDSSTVAAFLGIAIAAAGGGALANLPGLVALANIFAFSREQEREADGIGLELMVNAGYDPVQASEIWRGLIEERDAGLTAEEKRDQERQRDVFFASHPAPADRAQALALQAAAFPGGKRIVGEDRYLAQARAFRDMMMQDELRLQQYSRTLVIVERMKMANPGDADPFYYEGEVYRSRNDGIDSGRAMNAYGRALELDELHGPAWRGIGILHRRAGRQDKAAEAFRRYLELVPGAEDRLMIQSYVGA